MEENKAQKPANIERQENHDCQQFFGPVSGCVFAMPGSHVHMPGSNKEEPLTPLTKEDIDAICENPASTKEEYITPAEKEIDIHSNIELRRKLLKQSYIELIKVGFNQGSDWYYIYRMLEDNTIYAHDYQSFLDDLTEAGIDTSKIHKSSFTEISKRIKNNTTFPNWKVIQGKQQKVIDRGIELAQIAFTILLR